MPVTYFTSTGPLSFNPVPARDQAIGPIAVAFTPTPPDEVLAPPETRSRRAARLYRKMILMAAFAGMGALLLAA